MTNRERVSLERLIRTVQLRLSPGLLEALFEGMEEQFSPRNASYTTDSTARAWEDFKIRTRQTVNAYARRPENQNTQASLEAELNEYKRQYEERGELLREALQ